MALRKKNFWVSFALIQVFYKKVNGVRKVASFPQ